MAGTDIAYAAIGLRACYRPKRGTDAAYAAIGWYAMRGTGGVSNPNTNSTSGMGIRACYAMSGTDIANATRPCPRETSVPTKMPVEPYALSSTDLPYGANKVQY
eukprot:822006-Rhodomonas_salina.1